MRWPREKIIQTLGIIEQFIITNGNLYFEINHIEHKYIQLKVPFLSFIHFIDQSSLTFKEAGGCFYAELDLFPDPLIDYFN